MSDELTRRDCDTMLAFLPHFTLPINDELAEAMKPGGVFWYDYPPLVEDFQRLVLADPWAAYDYQPDRDGAILRDPQRLAQADLTDVRRVLTFIVRGERFNSGHVAAMIEDGSVADTLRRLAELRDSLPE
jgi:O-acetyl-ADP-ribose deacetylase